MNLARIQPLSVTDPPFEALRPIHFNSLPGTGWTYPHRTEQNFVMSTQALTDTELQAAAQACRIAAVQADQDAAKQSSPSVRATFEASAKRFRELAEKLERARISGNLRKKSDCRPP